MFKCTSDNSIMMSMYNNVTLCVCVVVVLGSVLVMLIL